MSKRVSKKDHALRGEVWLVDFEPVKGHEQGRTRPALVISYDRFNKSGAELVVVIPITGTDRNIRTHVRVDSPEGGLTKPSVIMCEAIRSVSLVRLQKSLGEVKRSTLREVEDRLRLVLGLS